MESYKEVRAQPLPVIADPSQRLAELWRRRREACSSATKEFHLQSFQIFLRRKLSPESPNRNMLLFHGTGVGKTCTAIQVAEEYILRPEFQDKKVIVLAGKAVQGSFRNQIFDVTRVGEPDVTQQCTGRRYYDLLLRAQREKLRWEDADSREKLKKTIDSIVNDFYDFEAYGSFAGRVERIRIKEGNAGLQKEFKDRLIIIDEAHNLRSGDETSKLVSTQIEYILKTVPGITLVLLTATPMFDTFDEILYYLNLFLWNDRRQTSVERIKTEDFFTKDGDFVSPDASARFRGWVNEYVSFIRGENPFTFPFRLPPPDVMIAPMDRTTSPRGDPITVPRKYLPLVQSMVESPQKDAVELAIGSTRNDMIYTLAVSPDPSKKLTECFSKGSNDQRFKYQYAAGIPAFLSPSMVAKHAAKFATVIRCIREGTGVVFVYSNYVRSGIELFAAALEEHGFTPYMGARMLENPSKEVASGSAGRYTILSDTNIDRVLLALRSKKNMNGEQIRVILGSPFVSEGVDFRYVRQVHILDPWDNMSRIDQIIGRGLRTCSHAALPDSQQNCTVYLHICRLPDSTQEALDEYVYRERVERKGRQIAKVKRVLQESALDCTLQETTNRLPDEWKQLLIVQERSQDKDTTPYALSALSSPSFEDGSLPLVCHPHPPMAQIEGYERPLSSYLDVKDEVYNVFVKLFAQKPIWDREELLAVPDMPVDRPVIQFLLNSAQGSLKLKDSAGREGTLESTGNMYSFKPDDAPKHATMVERITGAKDRVYSTERIEVAEEVPEAPKPVEAAPAVLDTARGQVQWKFGLAAFPPEILNWYVADTRISVAEKHAFMLTLPRVGALPYFMKGLVLPGVNYLVLGHEKLYNDAKELVIPVGKEKDMYVEWVTQQINLIVKAVKDENRLVCTMGENKSGQAILKFAAFKVEAGVIRREKREKTIKAKECSFYSLEELSTLANTLRPPGFAGDVKNKEDKCMVLGVFVRNAVAEGHPLIYWITPELMSVISEEPYKTTLRSKLK